MWGWSILILIKNKKLQLCVQLIRIESKNLLLWIHQIKIRRMKQSVHIKEQESEDEEHAFSDPKTAIDTLEMERINPQYKQELAVEEKETPKDNAYFDLIQEQEVQDPKTTQHLLTEESDQNYKDKDGNHDSEIEDPLLGTSEAVRLPEKETKEVQETEPSQNPISEESDENLKDPPLEAPNGIKLPEIINASFSFIKERDEQKPETTRSPKSKESNSKQEDENPTVQNEDPPWETPEPVKLPANDRSFTLIEEQVPELNQNPKAEESNPNSTQEYEDATIDAEDAPPKTPHRSNT